MEGEGYYDFWQSNSITWRQTCLQYVHNVQPHLPVGY